MQNGITTLHDLLSANHFSIPNFQRAYAWTTVHWQTFLDDLYEHPNNHGTYYLGQILLKEPTNNRLAVNRYEIVDGQQRLLTTSLLVDAASSVINNYAHQLDGEWNQFLPVLRETYCIDPRGHIRIAPITADHIFLTELLQHNENAPDPASRSQRNMQEASDFFRESFAEAANNDLNKLLSIIIKLRNSEIMVKVVRDYSSATQMFELQNDRGVDLSEIERVKSGLMHRYYLCAIDEAEANVGLEKIQGHFARIVDDVQRLDHIKRSPSEDDILDYHCRAYLPWGAENNGVAWGKPRTMLKTLIERIQLLNHENPLKQRRLFILDFSSSLAASFSAVREMLENRPDNDASHLICNLTVLNLWQGLWPILIKSYRSDDTNGRARFLEVGRLLERWSFCRPLSGRQNRFGEAELNRFARDFEYDWNQLIQNITRQLNELAIDYREIIRNSLMRPDLYIADRNHARYVLWRYENKLRAENHQPICSWNEAIGGNIAIDHISPQEYPVQNQRRMANGRTFGETYLHCLGNLVLDTPRAGAAAGNIIGLERLNYYLNNNVFLSRQEVGQTVQQLYGGHQWVWDEALIIQRRVALLRFCSETWALGINVIE